MITRIPPWLRTSYFISSTNQANDQIESGHCHLFFGDLWRHSKDVNQKTIETWLSIPGMKDNLLVRAFYVGCWMGCWGLLGWLLIVSQWIIPENSLRLAPVRKTWKNSTCSPFHTNRFSKKLSIDFNGKQPSQSDASWSADGFSV